MILELLLYRPSSVSKISCFNAACSHWKRLKNAKNTFQRKLMRTWNTQDACSELCNKIQSNLRYNSPRMFPFLKLSVVIIIIVPNAHPKKVVICYPRWNNGDKNYDHSSNYPRQPNLASNLQLTYPKRNEHNTWNALQDRNGLYCFTKAVLVE